MTGSIVVGYTATDAGADALALGARLARSIDAHLELVIVLPPEGTRSSAVVPPERAFEAHVRGQAEEWLRAAVAQVPADIRCLGHVRFNESFAEGIIAAGEEFDARLIVVGAGNGSTLGRHRLGSVASELVHSSPIPVALAPAGSHRDTDAGMPIPRVTAAVGTRAGADALLDAAVELATAARGTLRLVSLVPFDVPTGLDTGAITLAQDAHGEDVLAQVRASLPEGVAVEVERAAGDSVEDAVAHLRWHPGEVVMVGSSRLAQPRRLFLGSTAAKMLHELPVPMIVVPRTRAEAGER
ncbi:universal stress protein [Microbacterium sp. nov. GSS16]|uniref:universal stress protein n=1 Tax=Microbacterium sp. nov. GSS16 TaxID=3019890 RepID=UPI0023069495|nr:universal stress protein [Microbacterium sp. nov. GSS16]WCD93963.1 universal stress protein [Microbacterium sp. nov. GSS16]